MAKAYITVAIVFASASGLYLSGQALSEHKWAALTSTGTTAAFNVPGNDKHTLSVTVTGTPGACTIKLEGSVDGTLFADLSGDQTCTSSTVFHVVNKPVSLVRANLTALSGGSAPTVTASYLGAR